MPSLRLFGHCLVTGANRGLGLALVQQLLSAGNRVVATCRQPGRAAALNRLSGQFPGRLHVLPLDVARERSREELLRELPLVLESGPLGLLVNNAGTLHSGERFGQVTRSDLEASLATNAIGPFLLTQALAPLLCDATGERPGALVANISSEIGSLSSRQEFRTPSYAIGKAAQNMGTVLLARALAPRGIVVAAFNPGWLRTDMGGDLGPGHRRYSRHGPDPAFFGSWPGRRGPFFRSRRPTQGLVTGQRHRFADVRSSTPDSRVRRFFFSNQMVEVGTAPALVP